MKTMKHTNFHSTKGFTLIEILLVIASMSLISVLTVSFFSRFLLQNAVSNTVDQIAGELRKAQTYSMAGKQNSGWGVNYSSSTLTLFKGNTYATRNPALDETFQINPNISITGFTEIEYAKVTGMPNTTAIIVISTPKLSKTVTVNSQGVVNK